MTDTKHKLFMNKDLIEAEAFHTKMTSKIRKEFPDAHKSFKAGRGTMSKTTYDEHNAKHYDVLIEHIGCDKLLRTLGKHYADKGHEAMQYILKRHRTCGSEGKEKIAAGTYKTTVAAGLKDGVTPSEFRAMTDDLDSLRADLEGTDRRIGDTAYVRDLCDMVEEAGSDYLMQYKFKCEKLDEDDWRCRCCPSR